MIKAITILLLTIVISLHGQQLHQIYNTQEIDSLVKIEKLRESSAGYYYSYISEYEKAWNTYDMAMSWGIDSLDLSELSTEPAITHIVEMAKESRIVIISESHIKPQHRVFASQIIDTLYHHGYRFLGMETLTHNPEDASTFYDTELSTRGYPLNGPITGTYTKEPTMAHLLRKALEQGYTPFAYERVNKIGGKDRDEIQADNIIKYLEDKPDAKIILVVGYYHAVESNLSKRGNAHWLAYYLKTKMGIDPLTIYQDNFTEKRIYPQHEVLDRQNMTEPQVWVDNGKLASITPHVDIEIIHPKTEHLYGRPNWLGVDRKNIPLQHLDELGYPTMVKAYFHNEYPNGVPIDMFEVHNSLDTKQLLLPKGVFKVVYEGPRDTIQSDIIYD